MRRVRQCSMVLVAFVLIMFGLSPAFAQQTQTFTLQPGGQATITFEAFCTNFGQNFPESIEAPNALAPGNQRGAIAYIQSQGYASNEENALDAQYGLWRVVGAAESPQGGQIANDVVNAAPTMPTDPQGVSVIQAAQNGQVRVAVSAWQALGQPVPIGTLTDNFYGQGTLTVENTSSEALTLYHPIGALYPPVQAGEQTMIAYATNVQIQNPATAMPQSTTAPTVAPTTAPTRAPTLQPTTAATTGATVQPTVQATASPEASGQPGQLPVTGESNQSPWYALLVSIGLGLLVSGLVFTHLLRGKR